MTTADRKRCIRWCALVAGLAPGIACAAGPRMYAASAGVDGNPCTTASPCRTLQYAVSQVDPGGDVIVVDSAGYGAVTIAKSVSIVAPRGIHAGISVLSGVGVDVAGAGINVSLEGLSIDGLGAGSTGVRFTNGSRLSIARCTISNLTGSGLDATAPGSSVVIHDSSFDVNATGLRFVGVTATLERVRATRSATGVDISSAARVTIRASEVRDNSSFGIVAANSTGTVTTLAVDSTGIFGNLTGVSLSSSGAGSVISAGLIRSSIVHNGNASIAVNAIAPAVARVTLTANVIDDAGNSPGNGVVATGSGATALMSRNAIGHYGGLAPPVTQGAGAIVQTLGDNTITTSPPYSGTVTTVTGY